MQVHYLEVVTKDVGAVCAGYSAANGMQFGAPVAGLGNARTAALPGGGVCGVRAPMRESEESVVRPYWLCSRCSTSIRWRSRPSSDGDSRPRHIRNLHPGRSGTRSVATLAPRHYATRRLARAGCGRCFAVPMNH